MRYLLTFLLKILNVNKIEELNFKLKTSGKIIFTNKSIAYFDISNDTISLKLFDKNYQLIFNKEGILVNNLTDNIKTKYEGISDVYENIDKAITISIAVSYYIHEVGSIDYKANPVLPEPSGLTEWCINPRKSYCSRAHILAVITTHCGHAPSWVGGTDYGCVWGDFGCIAVTSFHC